LATTRRADFASPVAERAENCFILPSVFVRRLTFRFSLGATKIRLRAQLKENEFITTIRALKNVADTVRQNGSYCAQKKSLKIGIGQSELNKRVAKAAAGSAFFPIPPKTPPGGGEVPSPSLTIDCHPRRSAVEHESLVLRGHDSGS
jgi:hypothetical protein